MDAKGVPKRGSKSHQKGSKKGVKKWSQIGAKREAKKRRFSPRKQVGMEHLGGSLKMAQKVVKKGSKKAKKGGGGGGAENSM